jgi:predicted SAM-dependent methyltransferase
MSLLPTTRGAAPLLRRLREKRASRRTRRQLLAAVRDKLARGEGLRLVVGAGPSPSVVGAPGTPYEGWILTDVRELNALDAAEWRGLFPEGSVDRILAEHVIEHWTEEQLRIFLKTARPFLSARGRVRVAVPDGFHPDSSYIEEVRPGGTGCGSDDHKVLYTYARLAQVLTDAGWDYDFLEYFDEGGRFRAKPWEASDGYVRRSAENDPRNRERPLSYTSLIVDTRPRAAQGGGRRESL